MNMLAWFLVGTTLISSLVAGLAILGLMRLRRRVTTLQADHRLQLETVQRLQNVVRRISGSDPDMAPATTKSDGAGKPSGCDPGSPGAPSR